MNQYRKPTRVMPLRIFGHDVKIFGGPYRERPPGLIGVKMAEEIDLPSHVSIPTRDFSVPDKNIMIGGLEEALHKTTVGRGSLYVGCMGGIGRTGLFLAAAAKVAGVRSPVQYVRDTFNPHAVETTEQMAYIASLDVSTTRAWLMEQMIIAKKARFWRMSLRDKVLYCRVWLALV